MWVRGGLLMLHECHCTADAYLGPQAHPVVSLLALLLLPLLLPVSHAAARLHHSARLSAAAGRHLRRVVSALRGLWQVAAGFPQTSAAVHGHRPAL